MQRPSGNRAREREKSTQFIFRSAILHCVCVQSLGQCRNVDTSYLRHCCVCVAYTADLHKYTRQHRTLYRCSIFHMRAYFMVSAGLHAKSSRIQFLINSKNIVEHLLSASALARPRFYLYFLRLFHFHLIRSLAPLVLMMCTQRLAGMMRSLSGLRSWTTDYKFIVNWNFSAMQSATRECAYAWCSTFRSQFEGIVHITD